MTRTEAAEVAQAMTAHEKECLLYGIGVPIPDDHDWTEDELNYSCERALASPVLIGLTNDFEDFEGVARARAVVARRHLH